MQERHRKIVNYLELKGFGTADNLAIHCNVSAVTIRRDLNRLEQEGAVTRIHGGAVSRKSGAGSIHIHSRLAEHTEEKRAVAFKAVSIIEEGDILFIDAGSTAAYIAEQLPANMNLTVVTHSINVINILNGRDDIVLINLGGELDRMLNAFLGPVTEAAMQQFSVTRAFIGTAGIDINKGSVNNSVGETAIKQYMNSNARHSYLLADSSKFEKPALYLTIPIEDIRSVITDAGVAVSIQHIYNKAGLELIIA